MFLNKLKISLALGLTLGALSAGVGALGYRLLPSVVAQVPANGKPEDQLVAADQPQADKLTREIEQLRRDPASKGMVRLAPWPSAKATA